MNYQPIFGSAVIYYDEVNYAQREILLNLLIHLLLVGSVEGGEHLFGLPLLLALVPHHRDLVLQHLQSICL